MLQYWLLCLMPIINYLMASILGYGYLTDVATRFAGFFGSELVLGITLLI